MLFDPIAWVCWAVLFACVEYTFISGLGFVLLSFSALVVAGVLTFGFSLSEAQVWVVFFTSFGVFMTTLLRPLRRRYGKDKYPAKHHEGERAEVVKGPLTKTQVGAVMVQSTRLSAILSTSEDLDSIEEGSLVKIVRVDGRLVSVIACDD